MTPTEQEEEKALILETIGAIHREIKDVQIRIDLYKMVALIKDIDKEPTKANALNTLAANLKDIQATYLNSITVLELAFGVHA